MIRRGLILCVLHSHAAHIAPPYIGKISIGPPPPPDYLIILIHTLPRFFHHFFLSLKLLQYEEVQLNKTTMYIINGHSNVFIGLYFILWLVWASSGQLPIRLQNPTTFVTWVTRSDFVFLERSPPPSFSGWRPRGSTWGCLRVSLLFAFG